MFGASSSTSPGRMGFCPNSENRTAVPLRITTTFTQSYATGPTARCTVRVRATSGWKSRMTCLALSTDYSQELFIHQQSQDDFCGLQIKGAVRAP